MGRFGRALKRILPKSLLGRSLLIIVIPLILLQVSTAFTFFDRHWSLISRRLNSAVASEIAIVVEFMEVYKDPSRREWLFALAHLRQELQFRFLPGDRMPVLPSADGTDDFVARSLDKAMAEQTEYPYTIQDISDRTLEVTIQLPDGLLVIEVPRDRLFTVTTVIFVAWMVASSVILFAVATIFMRNQVRPVRRLAAAADALGKGRDVPTFKSEGATEVRQAGEAFKRMRERINRQIGQRTEMLAGVSHDLRTPLTRMRLQLAMMEGVEGTAELAEDVGEMERMIEGYLAFARGEGTEAMVPTEITALVEDVVGRMRRTRTGIDLHAEQPLTLPLKPHAFERCLTNILANADRYAQTMAVRVGARDGYVEVVVDDDGPGIPAASREDVFKAFFRLDQSRNPKTGGTGLGLTVARDVMRAMGGDIHLEDSPWGGLRVRLRLPL